MQRNQALLSDLLDVVTSIPTQWSGVGKNPKGTKKSLPQRGRQEFLLSLVFLTAPEGALNIKLVKCSSFFFFLFFSEYNFFTLVYLCCTINCISYESESVIHSVVSQLFVIMDCSPSGSSVHGILQARILEWVAFPFSRGSSQPRD